MKQRNRYSYRKVYEDFKHYHPELRKEATHWEPYAFSMIMIWFKDGRKATYEDYKHQVAFVKETWLPKDRDERSKREIRHEKHQKSAKTFSENLKFGMLNADITQKELALKTGMSKQSISDYANGKRIPSESRIERLAYALDLNYHDLAEDVFD